VTGTSTIALPVCIIARVAVSRFGVEWRTHRTILSSAVAGLGQDRSAFVCQILAK
jgi:hypothetical protein